MTLLIAWLLLYIIGVTHPFFYIATAIGWVLHVLWHSSATNKLF